MKTRADWNLGSLACGGDEDQRSELDNAGDGVRGT